MEYIILQTRDKALDKKSIPDIIVSRLPIYLNTLQHLLINHIIITSSNELGKVIGISAAQIRKDLSQFGEFGKQGSGYSVTRLIEVLQDILNLNCMWDLVIVGAGSLGTAIAKYPGFHDQSFRVAMIFDSNPNMVGTKVGEYVVKSTDHMEEELKNSGIKIAMLTLPASEAQKAADRLVSAGVKAILNYAPISLILPENVQVQYINPAQNLQHMTYYLE